MPIGRIDHVNIRTHRLTETLAFYRDILGLEVGPAPMVSDITKGAWVRNHAGEALFHIVRIGPEEEAIPTDQLRPGPTGYFNHVALQCTGYDAMQATIAEHGLQSRETALPSLGMRLLFVTDPNGVTIELNFAD